MPQALTTAQAAELLRTSPADQALATAHFTEELGAEDEARRVIAARVLLNELSLPTSDARWAALHLLQSAWWPVTPALLPDVLKATTAYLQGLEPRAPETQAAVLLWTHLLRDHERAGGTVTSLLEHVSPTVRAAGAATAARLGASAQKAIPALLALSRSEPVEVATEAASALAALAVDLGQSVGPALVQLVTTYQDGRRYFGLAGLRTMAGQDGAGLAEVAGVVPALLDAVSSDGAPIRAEAANLLGLVGGRDAGVKAKLEGLLGDAASEVRVQAVCALLRLGAISQERAVEVLTRPLLQEGPEVAQATIVSLSALDPAVLAPLKAALDAASAKAPAPVRAGVMFLFEARDG